MSLINLVLLLAASLKLSFELFPIFTNFSKRIERFATISN